MESWHSEMAQNCHGPSSGRRCLFPKAARMGDGVLERDLGGYRDMAIEYHLISYNGLFLYGIMYTF